MILELLDALVHQVFDFGDDVFDGRDLWRPVMIGIAQYAHSRSHPSEIFR
jgi:hypothetical protein